MEELIISLNCFDLVFLIHFRTFSPDTDFFRYSFLKPLSANKFQTFSSSNTRRTLFPFTREKRTKQGERGRKTERDRGGESTTYLVHNETLFRLHTACRGVTHFPQLGSASAPGTSLCSDSGRRGRQSGTRGGPARCQIPDVETRQRGCKEEAAGPPPAHSHSRRAKSWMAVSSLLFFSLNCAH